MSYSDNDKDIEMIKKGSSEQGKKERSSQLSNEDSLNFTKMQGKENAEEGVKIMRKTNSKRFLM